MIIKNGLVYTSRFRFEPGEILIRDGFFAEPSAPDRMKETVPESAGTEPEVLDASGCYVIPGLVDIHLHGCMGMDFCDGTGPSLREILRYEAVHGITAVCPATMTLPAEELLSILSVAADFADGQRNSRLVNRQKNDALTDRQKKHDLPDETDTGEDEADLIGINMEGPFISGVKKGAQDGKYILPFDSGLCRRFLEASRGLVKIIGIAPEENPGFEEAIREIRNEVRISLAHTNADYDTAMRAFQAGACHAVHLFNAMPEMTHREPGVAGAVRDQDHVMAELICDGNHIHPSVIRAAFDMLTDERIILISDSMRATGKGEGLFTLGGQDVWVQGGRAVLAQGGNLAGSVSNLMDCLRTAVKVVGIPLESAVRCATINPARAIGAEKEYGSIEPARHGNVVLLDRTDLSVRAVVKDGSRIV